MADDKLFQVMVEISREVFSIENVNFYSTLRELKRDIEKMRRGSNYTSAEGDSPSRSSSSSEICLAITPPSSEIRGQIPRVLIPKYLAIYESFIRPGAQQELNLTAQTREQLRAIFEARPILPFRVDCFDIADDEVRSILFENIYPLLLQRVRKHYRGI
ncbi:uncharacterized protein BJ171DRAFT_516622 [Polychytrium aggregatum]|uniref:uncharacterized protein n=1 Tax=Polychytrium aggregatum TaxID=110093 RepID=UPI0022FDF7C7|nr:uncharacterized protein BJ171DRAFT_516622 [Polychytrium aggregatum]KAI9201825.1 hypothetical protein BJ171DRAFT_516622 [Polychytrium aggregatum]